MHWTVRLFDVNTGVSCIFHIAKCSPTLDQHLLSIDGMMTGDAVHVISNIQKKYGKTLTAKEFFLNLQMLALELKEFPNHIVEIE